MRKLAFVLVLGLVACANQTAMDRATILEQSFTTAETAFVAYLSLPDCDSHPNPCSEDAVVARISPLDNSAFNAVQAYRDAVVAGKADTVLNELLTAANTALAALTTATANMH